MTLQPGTRLGAYDVLGLVGAGGMGEVYRARDMRLARDVAVKVLPAGVEAEPDRLKRFEQEARAAAAISHPNVVSVFDVGRHSIEGREIAYVVSELVQGQTLRQLLQNGALSLRKAIDYTKQLTNGLAAAHEKGIVHRDLKPENVIIADDGRLKILDFGLAKLTERDLPAVGPTEVPTTPVGTQAGVLLGTIEYMAPEQVRGQTVDHRTDLFAVGAILYEMLTGRRAFEGETSIDVMTAILKEDPSDSPLTERHVPPMLVRIVDRCLQKLPKNRFQSAADLAFAIDALPSTSDSSPATLAVPSDSARRTGPRTAVLAVAVAALLFAAAFAFRNFARVQPSSEQLVRFELSLPRNVLSTQGISSPLVSPDGRYIVWSATTPATVTQLWIRRLDWAEARVLPGTDGVTGLPFWSPDSRAVAFFSNGSLKKIDLSGSMPQVVCDAVGFTGGTWNSTGTILFATGSGGLLKVPASGGQPVPLTRLDEARKEVRHRWPQFLPDGQQFLFLAQPGNITYRASLDGRPPIEVVRAESNAMYAEPGHLLFIRRGALLAQPFDPRTGTLGPEAVPLLQDVGFASTNARVTGSVSQNGVLTYLSSETEDSRLQWLDRRGVVLETIGEPFPYAHIALSRDGRSAAIARTDEQRDIWIMDLARAQFTRFTSGTAAESEPQWSPDGTAVAFVSTRDGFPRIFRKSVSGESPEQHVEGIPDPARLEDWSSDGRYIIYIYGNDIWAMPQFGDRKPFVVLQTPEGEDEPQLSPDSRWIAYTSGDSGASEVYLRPFPGPGARQRISTAGGNQPRWRADGRELFYLTGDGTLMASQLGARPDGMVAAPPEPLFRIQAPASNAIDPYDVSPDGQRFLVGTLLRGTADRPLKVILNWTRLLAQ